MMNPIEEHGDSDKRHMGYFHELDAWTEYWDIYHPETNGYYYFGLDNEPGLLNRFLPRDSYPPPFQAWNRMALLSESPYVFNKEINVPDVRRALLEVDTLVGRVFADYFGDASNTVVQLDYLNAMFRFACNTLPPAKERDARIPDSDPRKSTARRHTLAGDLMWFAWALHIEAVNALVGEDNDHSRRNLMLAGVAMGCAANFTWCGHRRTRAEYKPDDITEGLLINRGMNWSLDFNAAAQEIHALYDPGMG